MFTPWVTLKDIGRLTAKEFVLAYPDLLGLFSQEELEEIRKTGDTWGGSGVKAAKIEIEQMEKELLALRPKLKKCFYCGRIFAQTLSEEKVNCAKFIGVTIDNTTHRDYYCGDCHQERGFLSDGSESETWWLIFENNRLVVRDRR